jgi:hypothetical protein
MANKFEKKGGKVMRIEETTREVKFEELKRDYARNKDRLATYQARLKEIEDLRDKYWPDEKLED